MRTRRIGMTLLVTALGAGVLGAAPPKKQPIGRYVSLWTNSPFTVKPEIVKAEEAPNALEDYVLTGVSKLPEGYFVVLMNKKKRDERIRIAPNDHNSAGFKVVKVTQDPYDYKQTEVEIAVGGGKTGVVTYDEKYLALKTPTPQKKPTTGGKPTSSGGRPPMPGTGDSRGRTQVRRVPTPPTKR